MSRPSPVFSRPSLTLALLALVASCVLSPPSGGAEQGAADGSGLSPAGVDLAASDRPQHIARLRELYAGDPATWPAPRIDAGVEWQELGLAPKPAHPADEAVSPELIRLGKQLFYEPRLSGSGQIACASCHDPDLGWSDGHATPFGHNRKLLRRNAPAILNGGHRKSLFWDGRAASLEDQATAVLNNVDEMRSSAEVVAANLAAVPQYVEAFRQVFGIDLPTMEHAVRAIAAFERTVVSSGSRFDSFLKGRQQALSDDALAGLHLFRTDARCLNCHHGPLLTDDKFHHIGLSRYGLRFEELGRYEITQDPQDVGKIRTPSLRNIANTAPYMHNGLFDLDEVLRLYNSGMPNQRPRSDQQDDPLFPKKSPLIKPLKLSPQDLADLKAFLHALSEPHRRVDPPELPPFR